jgi:hypothetical protein
MRSEVKDDGRIGFSGDSMPYYLRCYTSIDIARPNSLNSRAEERRGKQQANDK